MTKSSYDIKSAKFIVERGDILEYIKHRTSQNLPTSRIEIINEFKMNTDETNKPIRHGIISEDKIDKYLKLLVIQSRIFEITIKSHPEFFKKEQYNRQKVYYIINQQNIQNYLARRKLWDLLGEIKSSSLDPKTKNSVLKPLYNIVKELLLIDILNISLDENVNRINESYLKICDLLPSFEIGLLLINDTISDRDLKNDYVKRTINFQTIYQLLIRQIQHRYKQALKKTLS